MTEMTEEVESAISDVFGLCFELEKRVKALEHDALESHAEDTAPVFTVVEGGKNDPPQGQGQQAIVPRSNRALGRWKEFSTKVTPGLSDFIAGFVRSQPDGYLQSDVLHDAMIALCEKQGIEIDWLTDRDEGPLFMGPDVPLPE